MKREHKQVRKAILGVLRDKKEHSYGEIERKANTNWKTVRQHCEDLELFGAITISNDNRMKITQFGLKILEKIENQR